MRKAAFYTWDVFDKCTRVVWKSFSSRSFFVRCPRPCLFVRKTNVCHQNKIAALLHRKEKFHRNTMEIQNKYLQKWKYWTWKKSMCVLRSSTCTRAILFILFLPHWYFDGIIDRCENFPMAALIYGRDCRECSPSPHLSKVTSCTFPFSIIFTWFWCWKRGQNTFPKLKGVFGPIVSKTKQKRFFEESCEISCSRIWIWAGGWM